MIRAIYPGSFDPVTNGHLDVVQRAAAIFDEVVVALAHNETKTPLFSAAERMDLLRDGTRDLPRVTVRQFDGLLVQFARDIGAHVIVRGLRAISDFEFEFQMALMNRKLDSTIEAIFLMPREEYSYLSSRFVKEIARLGGNIADFVPPAVAEGLERKFGRR